VANSGHELSVDFKKILKNDTARVLLLTAAIRMLLFGWTAAFAWQHYSTLPQFLSLWKRWDAAHYVTLAEIGRQTGKIPPREFEFISRFPPLYAIIVNLTAKATRLSAHHSALLVTFVCMLIASVILYRLMLFEHYSSNSALWSVVFMNTFPTSYFASAAYSEALFLCLLLGYFYTLRSGGNFPRASILLGYAALTRMVALCALPVLALEFFRNMAARQTRRLSDIIWFVVPALACLGPLAVNFFYLKLPGYGADFAQGMYLQSYLPFHSIISTVSAAVEDWRNLLNHDFIITRICPAVFSVLCVSLFLGGARKLAAGDNLFFFTYTAVLSVISWPVGVPRYWLSAFPLFMALGLLRSSALKLSILTIFAAGLLYFSLIFISGEWAF
jgi:hypothetical protein